MIYVYVVEFNECGLNSGGHRNGQDWWFRQWNQPGMVARTTVVKAAPPGALLHIHCDDKEEAEFVRDHMISHDIPSGLVKVRRLRIAATPPMPSVDDVQSRAAGEGDRG